VVPIPTSFRRTVARCTSVWRWSWFGFGSAYRSFWKITPHDIARIILSLQELPCDEKVAALFACITLSSPVNHLVIPDSSDTRWRSEKDTNSNYKRCLLGHIVDSGHASRPLGRPRSMVDLAPSAFLASSCLIRPLVLSLLAPSALDCFERFP